jgi:type VI secretion system protein ImpA
MNPLNQKLLQPVSAEQPCGPDFSNKPIFDELATLAKGKPEVEMGEVKKPAEPPDWRELRGKSAEYLGASKHLQVAVMYCCSLLKTEGVSGLSEGLQFIRGLLEQYWVELYPRLDPEDNNDPTQRLNILGALNATGGPFSGWLTVIDNLYASEICKPAGMPPISFRQLIDAKLKLAGAPDLAKLVAAIREAGSEAIGAKRQSLNECLAATQGIDQFLTATLSAGNTVSFEVLEKALQELLKELEPFASGATGQIVSESGGEISGGNIAAGSIAVHGSIRSRDDIVRVIDSICSYYAQVEPSSPVPFLLKRAQKMVKMNFVEAVQELSLATVDSLRPSMGSAVDPHVPPPAET